MEIKPNKTKTKRNMLSAKTVASEWHRKQPFLHREFRVEGSKSNSGRSSTVILFLLCRRMKNHNGGKY